MSELWEGEARPGHFDGVATVVAKLLIAVSPDVALFGEKDFQQLAVIRRMVADLGIPDRDRWRADGARARRPRAVLAQRLSCAARSGSRRLALPRALEAGARPRSAAGAPVAEALHEARASLRDAGFSRIDYFALVDAATLQPLDEPAGEMRLIAAAVIGTTRLIDNIAV